MTYKFLLLHRYGHGSRVFLLSKIVLLLSLAISAQTTSDFDHPRGIIKSVDIPDIRDRAQSRAYAPVLEKMKEAVIAGQLKKNDLTSYDISSFALISAQLYLLTGEIFWALKSQAYVKGVLQDSVYFLNPIGRGLTKADQLLKIMMAYDYCYDAWDLDFRKHFSQLTFEAILSLSSNMGREANYDLASNWMGVRYGTVLYASLVWDDYEVADQENSKTKSFTYDASHRVNDFALANIHSGGWNVESMGYQTYGWSFVMPALVAWQNRYGLSIKIFTFYDRLIRSMKAFSIFSVPINSISTVGIKPDFSDDGSTASSRLVPYIIHLAPDSLKSHFRWINRYYNERKNWERQEDGGFESILYDDFNEESIKPPNDWLHFVDHDQGMVVMRNEFKDEKDIIVAFTATSHRRGHQGGDNLSFRLIGLGNIWVIGSGRTAFVAGQSSFFKEIPSDSLSHDRALGKLISYQVEGLVTEATAAGSCTGVIDHERSLQVEFNTMSLENPVTIRLQDVSKNGRIWRLNTPEFNRIEINPDGFVITAPNGHQLLVKVIKNDLDDYKISSGQLRYGGKTIQHNYGIWFEGKEYRHSKYIDIECSGSLAVELSLQ